MASISCFVNWTSVPLPSWSNILSIGAWIGVYICHDRIINLCGLIGFQVLDIPGIIRIHREDHAFWIFP